MSIQQWTDAFLIFMGIFIEKYPEQAPHLLKYCYFIREMNKMLGDKAWRIYDENFRMLKETVELPWQKPVEELRIKAASSNYQFQQPFRANTGLLESAMPLTMGNNALITPAHLPTGVNHAQDHMQEPIVHFVNKNQQIPTLSPSPQQSPSQLPSPVNPKSLGEFLVDYDSDQASYLINGFTHGFRLGCTSVPSSCVPQNHKSTLGHPDIIEDYIQTGLNKGRIAGPFSNKPFEQFVVSPLGLVPKGSTGKFRVIHDLSFPKNQSVNSNIPRENSAVQYDSIDQVVDLVQRLTLKMLSGSYLFIQLITTC